MALMQAVLDRARIPLNDADKTRYPDAELLQYAVAGVERLFALRPDLRFGQYGTALATLTPGTTFPAPERYLQVIADYVGFRAETKDDEHVISGRATAFMQAFEQGAMS